MEQRRQAGRGVQVKARNTPAFPGAIFLPGNRVIEHPSNGEEAGKFLFEVVPGGDRERMTANHETYLLMASTQNDMEDWVKTIRRVIWAPFGGGIFGQKLEETVRYERRYGNKLAPMLVEQCVDFIRHRGLKEEGLFRLPGQANLVKELQDAFDCGEKPAFNSTTDVHTVASLLKLYLRELPEPVIPFCKYDEFLACTKTLSKEQDTGMKELRRQVESLPLVNYNLLKYICRFLDEVQSYSGVNKMSVQNLATVFGPNILRPRVEDPVAIMEGAVMVQQLMAVLIGQHGVLFPSDDGESPSTPELCNNNNNGDSPKRPTASQLQNRENNNTGPGRQCTWETPGSPGRAGQDDGSPRSGSPRNGPTPGRFELTRSPPALVKKNPAFSKGSGIVTNGSFSSSSSSSPSAEPGQDKGPAPPGAGALQTRRQGALKGPGTKMGVQNGGVRMGVSSTDVVNGTLNGRNGLWSPPGYVTFREGKGRDGEQQHRLSTYDNVQVGGGQQTVGGGQPGAGSGSEDKQSIDSATWSTSSCEISLPDNSTSFRSSTTTCPEQDFYAAGLEDALLDGATAHDGKGTERHNSNGGGRSRAMSSSENSETAFPLSNGAANHSALHSLVASLKQEMFKQKTDYECRIKSLEHRNLELEAEMLRLHDDLEQERKKFTMVEIKLRNAERAKDDAEKRNDMLQKEMEQFFSTFGDLTADPRRPDRASTIWIQ
ncbi:rho GTPase-activating protein 24 isoform X2 [Electrophorus electricus]|uniref:rho GTPase-activating protein 24 isoform X2 n=1 Tax=Electrophorus electricus TaxID=8005 RepID=UPI0015CFD9B4|nr:rho GTPase-activating protein 24 isoform X2 [Electrophorus electricus]